MIPPAVPTVHAAPRFQPGRTLTGIMAGVLLLAVVARLYLIFSTHATEEDFYITLRYAENVARGAGFVYNPREHVLGTTTPLYTLLLALSIRLHLDPVLAGKLLCVTAEALSCWLVWRLGCTLQRPLPGLCAAVCLAIAPLNLTESVKGMESSLVACACIAAWTLWAEGKSEGAWLCAGIAILLRIDGVALAAILLLACVGRDRRLPWTGIGVCAAVVIPWIVFATGEFGSPIPTSLRAKLIVYGRRNDGLFPNVLPFLRLMTHNPLSALLFVGALVTTLLAGRAFLLRLAGKGPDNANPREGSIGRVTPIVAWLLVYYGGMAFSKVFLFGWYFLPPTPAYYLIACMGWGWLANAAGGRLHWDWLRQPIHRLAAAPLLAGILLSMAIVPRVAKTLQESQSVETGLRIPIGLWLKQHAAPYETVMLEPIGYIGYYSHLRVLDTVGLVSPEVLPFYRRQEPSPYHALWKGFRPEWVLLRAGEWQELQRYEQTLPAYQRLPTHYHLTNSWRSSDSSAEAAPAFYLFHRIEE